MIPTFTVKLMNEQLLFYYYNEHTTCLLAVQITHIMICGLIFYKAVLHLQCFIVSQSYKRNDNNYLRD